MKLHHSKNIASIKCAIQDDEHPISLIALELRSITKGMELVESMRLATLLVDLTSYNCKSIMVLKASLQYILRETVKSFDRDLLEENIERILNKYDEIKKPIVNIDAELRG